MQTFEVPGPSVTWTVGDWSEGPMGYRVQARRDGGACNFSHEDYLEHVSPSLPDAVADAVRDVILRNRPLADDEARFDGEPLFKMKATCGFIHFSSPSCSSPLSRMNLRAHIDTTCPGRSVVYQRLLDFLNKRCPEETDTQKVTQLEARVARQAEEIVGLKEECRKWADARERMGIYGAGGRCCCDLRRYGFGYHGPCSSCGRPF
jgi:hypothetical protein